MVLKVGFHGSQGRSRSVAERQIAKARKLIAREWAKTRRVGRSGDGSVIRSRGK